MQIWIFSGQTLQDALHEISSAMGFLWLQPRIIKKDQAESISNFSWLRTYLATDWVPETWASGFESAVEK